MSGALTFAIIYLRRRTSEDDAARFADKYFDLKDTLTSDLHFQREGRSGEFLHFDQSASRRPPPRA